MALRHQSHINKTPSSGMETAEGSDPHFNRIFYSILLAAGALYSFLNAKYQTGIYNDDSLYVILAKDFWHAASLHPLLNIKPDFPMPGLPLLMLPFTKLIGTNWLLLEWLSVWVSVISVYVFGRWMKKWFTSSETLVIVALYAFNPIVVRFSGILMAGPYYLLGALLSFYLTDELLRKFSVLKSLGLGFVLGWGSLMRPEAVLLMIIVTTVLAFDARGRKILKVAIWPMLGWLVFSGFWFGSHWKAETEYGGDLSSLMLYWPKNLTAILPFVFEWFKSYLIANWGTFRSFSPDAFFITGVILVGIHLVGYWFGGRRLWNKPNVDRLVLVSAGLFALSFYAVHVFWHVVDRRYLLPLVPFIIILLVSAVNRRGWGKFILFIVFMFYLQKNGTEIYNMVRKPNPLNTPPWKSFNWLKTNTASNSKILSNIAPSVDLFAERQASPMFNATSVDLLQYLLLSRKFDYLVLREGTATAPGVGDTEDPNLIWNRYRRWVRNYPDRFLSVFADPAEKTEIFSVKPAPNFVKAYQKFIDGCQESQSGHYDEAYHLIQESLSINPLLGCAHNLLGALYLMSNQYPLAEQEFLTTTRELPDSPNGFLNLASLYNREGETVPSLEYLRKGKEISEANGDEEEQKEKIKNLKNQWDQKNAQLFIDFPHPSLYNQP